MTGVSLVVTTDPPEPVPPPAQVYVLRMDEEHAEFLFSLIRKVQVVYEAGHLSYDIYQVLADGKVPYQEVIFRLTQIVGGLEVKYADE